MCVYPENAKHKGPPDFCWTYTAKEGADHESFYKLICTSVCSNGLPDQAIQPENKVQWGVRGLQFVIKRRQVW